MNNKTSNNQSSKKMMGNLGNPTQKIRCNRCSGTGFLPQFNHIENGICFSCRGEGYFGVYQKAA